MKHDWKVTLKKRGTELIEFVGGKPFGDLGIGERFLLGDTGYVKLKAERTGSHEGSGIVNAREINTEHLVGIGPLVRVSPLDHARKAA